MGRLTAGTMQDFLDQVNDFAPEKQDVYTKIQVDTLIANAITQNTSGFVIKDPVSNTEQLATVYPNAINGWIVPVLGAGPNGETIHYEFAGGQWTVKPEVNIKASTFADGIMTKEHYIKLNEIPEEVAPLLSPVFTGIPKAPKPGPLAPPEQVVNVEYFNENKSKGLQSALNYTPNIGLNLAGDDIQLLDLRPAATGNVVFTYGGIERGRGKVVYIFAGSIARQITLPSGGLNMRNPVFTIPANKIAALVIQSTGTTEAEVITNYSIQE